MHYWFITGTGSGLGKAIAETVLQNTNAFVFGISRHSTIDHERYLHSHADLANTDDVVNYNFDQCENADSIILINNAGTLGKIDHADNIEPEIIIKTYQLNCISPHILISKFIKQFKDRNCKKVIINISSGAANSPYDGWSMYCATKAALQMMTLCVAREQELTGNKIKLLSLAPGVMDTKMQEEIRATGEDVFSKKNKFVDLKKNQQLYDIQEVAKKISDIVEHTSINSETIQRIVI
ncbi:MAG: SDR family NAD(P)-dependent oxidoreductase [Chitinophagales bacterium]